jgi:GTP-binding protein
VHFIDEATIEVKAGDGGNGCVAFRREAHVPYGGPSGGDGGDGGSVVLIADAQLATLLDFKFKRHYKAPRGEDGRNKDQYGKRGEDLVLRVPVGTVVIDDDTGDTLADLAAAAETWVAARGGQGGRGNIHFKSSWNQAPRQSTPGTAGEARRVRLELKLLADVGLLGFPNVGKSTFIARVSRARPKIADYPFTTLAPNLGVADLGDQRTLVIADIPGLIEGAADGAGLGHRFLRHVERTGVLLHILEAAPSAGPDRAPLQDFDRLNAELHRYAPALAQKPQVVALNKADLTETRAAAADLDAALRDRGHTLLVMSAATGEGVTQVLETLWRAARPDPD